MAETPVKLIIDAAMISALTKGGIAIGSTLVLASVIILVIKKVVLSNTKYLHDIIKEKDDQLLKLNQKVLDAFKANTKAIEQFNNTVTLLGDTTKEIRKQNDKILKCIEAKCS